jgi:hypothetical protein
VKHGDGPGVSRVCPCRERYHARRMNEVVFIFERAPGGGFSARAVGESIFTEADDLAQLHERVREAVHCHFDEGKAPTLIRLASVQAG